MVTSQITSVEVENFMSFPRGRVDFDDSGIINMKGFNDSGKSAFLMATAVCLLNVYPQSQKSFIRDGADSFLVRVSFSDGVEVVRHKFQLGTSLYEMFRDGVLIFSTEGNKVDAVPAPIAEYLQLFNDGATQLHFRRKNDPLLLVETSGRENFEMLNQVLKTRELADASRLASETANSLARDVADKETEFRATQISLDSLWITEELLRLFHLHSEVEGSLQAELSALVALSDVLLQSDSVQVISEVSKLDSQELHDLEALRASLQGIHSLPETLPLPVLDTSLVTAKLHDLEQLLTLLEQSSPALVPELPTLVPDEVVLVTSLLDSLTELHQVQESLIGLEAVLDADHQVHAELMQLAASQGMSVVTCPKCSELIAVEV